ncbi:SusC/RagA family TonB-linked outer membrane protein [Sphingobacterium bovistauri]|uniref:SusC/RagA family TonB-linked outer membrane protein n=1 Tax=Sphingobacterium bovistauri TaxID=2781959 RepID=A0ABS7Z9D7_9SPHI|nr:SusC/RagA family TonB-linked outer membrane protein [Sphingobacterium bovistauri]MCA5006197.1 SusC/RagA family TonB-linked outer membrane protein [Sphingobacterium bovistauri]
MKVSVIVMLVSFQFVFANSEAQHVSLNLKNAKLDDAFKQITAQTSFKFFYNDDVLSKASLVSLNVKNEDVNLVLSKLLSSSLFEYKIVSNTILVSLLPQERISRESRLQTNASGIVVDSDGNPISNATVILVGSSNVTTTDKDGKFTIVAPIGSTLEVRYVGYKSARSAVSSLNNIRVVLISDGSTNIEEVSVIATGYQNLNRKLFTGSATSLKGSDVKQDGIIDVSRMLEGRAAGVSVQNVSGTFGAAPKIRVRGATSITGENKPLWVVDGVILEDVVNISNEQLSTGDINTLIGSSVAGLNADDIESFNILKDAAATAQYGARAMNGVVVITTKKGRVGKTMVSYTGNFSSYLKPSYNTFNIMNSSDQMSVYSEMSRKGYLNFSSSSRARDGGVFTKMNQMISTYDPIKGGFLLENTPEAKQNFLSRYALTDTDWFDVLFKNSFQQEHSVSFSSGTEGSQTYFSTSYLNDNGWAAGNNVERYTANLNNIYRLSDKLTVKFITAGSIRNQSAPGTVGRVSNPVEGRFSRDFDINPFSYALNTSRTLTAYDEHGNRENFTRNFADFNILNELDNNSLDLSMLDFKLQGGVNYKITKNLSYDLLGAYRYVKSSNEHKIRENSNMANAYRANYDAFTNDANDFLFRDPESPEGQKVVVLPYGGFYNTNDDFLKSYMVRNSLEFDKSIDDKHLINFYGFQEIRLASRQNRNMIGYGYQYDKGGVPFIDPNIVKQAVMSNLNYYGMNNKYDRFVAFMGRGAYSYDGKYSINATGRYDGSNQLGKSAKARWLPTWNISGAWNIDRESFYVGKDFTKILNRAAIRMTYGLTASLGTATNSALILRNGSALRPYLTETESVMNLEYIENSELTWEKQYETNLGFDLGFFNDKLNLTVDLYKRDGFDLISPIRTSGITGQYITNANYADMKSKGIEVTLSGPILKSDSWNWTSNFNFGYNENKIVTLNGRESIFGLVTADGGPQLGKPYRGLYSIEFKGLSHDEGIPTFINQEGEESTDVNLQSLETSFLKYEGPTDPKLTGGFFNTLSYKNFSLGTLLTFSMGNKIRLNPAFSSNYTDLDAMPNEFKDRWTLPGDEELTNVPSLLYVLNSLYVDGYPFNTYNYSSIRIADGGFLKLKQVTFTYNFAEKLAQKIRGTRASLTLAANNPWLIYSDKKLKGQDPEFFASGGVALPIPKQYTLSLKVGF